MNIDLKDVANVSDVSKIKTANVSTTEYSATDGITIELSRPIDIRKLIEASCDCG